MYIELFNLPVSTTILIITTAVIAGLVRGFSGFGGALIFMPVASSLVDPRLAAGTFLIVDFLAALPMAYNGMKLCDWRTVWPAVLGAALLVPVGTMVLAMSDTLALRWAISLLTLALWGLIVSGWRYGGMPKWPLSLGVGALAGFMGGLAQISGPPVIAYWMSGPAKPLVVRANIVVFFFLSSLATFLSYGLNGIFSADTAKFFMLLLPAYVLALYAGTKMFGLASGVTYRRVAMTLVAIAAITSLPILDAVLR